MERQGDAPVIVFHGGHMRAPLALGEDIFTALGCTVLAPSRPGYGQTPLQTGTSPSGFADVTRELCDHIGIAKVAAAVGISAGGRTAVTLAAQHPDLTPRLILESAVGFLPWPDRHTHFAANIALNPVTEKATWAAVHTLIRLSPAIGLRLQLRELSTEPANDVVTALTDEDRATLVALFSHMRSGAGFINDLRSSADVTCEVTQPTLVIASRKDRAVPFAHAESLAASIQDAELIVSESNSHWFAADYPVIADRIRTFLASDPSPGWH